jgi:multicomponent K+:H+ antiporter subunit A
MALTALLLVPFLGSLLFLVLPRAVLSRAVPARVAILCAAVCLCLTLHLTLDGGVGNDHRVFLPWIPALGLNVSLWLDGPALFFSWLVTAVGLLIFIYAAYYMDPQDSPWRFFGTLLFFMGSMLGVVLSRNVLFMFLFWELTSISSFILIGHWHEKEGARAGALRALVITGGGGLFLLVGIAIVFWIVTAGGIPAAEALEWDQLWANRQLVLQHPAGVVAMICLLVGAFTKSAQWPFHFWLPGAMEAPTPVSAFLHAATMVKAGIYLLGRLYPIFWDAELWLLLVGGTGVLTMLFGGFMALLSRDLKQLLAHSTVSQLGLLTAYYGFGFGLVDEEKKLPLDLLLIASHALFKGALFMLVGVIDHGAGTRDWTRLGGLRCSMPVTALLVSIGAASMAGLPLTLGFVAKELFLKTALRLETGDTVLLYILPIAAVIASAFTMAYCLRIAVSPFWGTPRDPEVHAHEGGPGLLVPPAVLILLCLAGGLYVPFKEGPLAALTNEAYFATKSGFKVAFFLHLDKLVAIAAFLYITGPILYRFTGRIEALYVRLGRPRPFMRIHDRLFDEAIPGFAKWLARLVQSPSLQRNLTISLAVIVVAIAGSMTWSGFGAPWRPELSREHLLAGGVVVMVCACLCVVLASRVLLFRIIAMSPIGLLVTLYFLLYKAPDLALTQILVEVVTLVVLLMLLFRAPQAITRVPPGAPGLLRAGIAIAAGLMMAVLTYAGFQGVHRSSPIAGGMPTAKDYYLQNAKYPALGGDEALARERDYPGWENMRSGGGNNAVNVILVDFRGIDTMGEILVLSVAAIGVLVLLTKSRHQGMEDPVYRRQFALVQRINERMDGEGLPPPVPVTRRTLWPGPSLLFMEVARFVPAMLLAFSTVLFFAGHNAPGGGFIAGLMAAIAIVLLLLAFPKDRIPRLYRVDYLRLIPAGLFVAVGTGMASMLLGLPFLTSDFVYLDIPMLGSVGLASAMAFDFGIFVVVVGITLLIIEKFGRE